MCAPPSGCDTPPGVLTRPSDAVVVRVATEVAAIDREFDYLVPSADVARLAGAAVDGTAIGAMVRIDLAGRRVGGWVVDADVEPPVGVVPRPVAKVRGLGPDAATVSLAAWGAWRWAGRRSWLLATASPVLAVRDLPAPRRRPPSAPPPGAVPVDIAAHLRPGRPDGVFAGCAPWRPVVVRLAPATDPTPLVAAVAQRGPTLVLVPSQARAAALAGRLRRAGADVALLPDGWAQARAGAGVVIGPRAAAWAPCAGLAAVVVVDGHDEALVSEQAPTWSAVAVAVERARRAAVPCIVTSPCPTLELLRSATLVTAPPAAERHGWAPLEVVDQRHRDPREGLWSERVVAVARGAGRVVVVLNRTGRAPLLACRACGELARCEVCGAAVGEGQVPPSSPSPVPLGGSGGLGGAGGSGVLVCPRCRAERPEVCAACGSIALRRVRLGVGRAREQLAALVGEEVGEVTAASPSVPATRVLIGTVAVLHRVERADAVAFVDLDQHLLAAHYRAGEEALALLARASRLVGGRRRGRGRVVAQTHVPDHPVVRAAAAGDPSLATDADTAVRGALRLPPVVATAVVSGPGAMALAGALSALTTVEVLGPDRDRWVVRAADHALLCDALAAAPRPAAKVRVDVDPLRM